MPNRVVQWYRGQHPDDTRPDDELTIELAVKYPDTFQTYPDAVADFERINTELREQYKKFQAENATAGEKIKHAAGKGIRAAAETLAGAPEGLGAFIAGGAKKLDEEVADLSFGQDARPVEEYTSYKLGQDIGGAIRKAGEKISPDTIEGLDDSFWLSKVPEGLGSAAGFMAGGAAGRIAKIPQTLGIAGLGAMTQGAGAWKEAKAAGASDDDAYKVFLLNAGVGTSEVLPLSKMLKRLDGVSGGSFTKLLINAGKESFEESLQEAGQQFAQNYFAKKYYDQDRNLLKDIAENAEVGGVTGALFSVLTQAIGAKIGKIKTSSKEETTKSSQTTTGSNVQMGTEMPVQPEAKAEAGAATGDDGIDVRQNFVTDEDKERARKLASLQALGKTGPEVDGLSAEVGKRIDSAPALLQFYTEELEKAKAASATLSRTEPAANEARPPAGTPTESAPPERAPTAPAGTASGNKTVGALSSTDAGLNEAAGSTGDEKTVVDQLLAEARATFERKQQAQEAQAAVAKALEKAAAKGGDNNGQKESQGQQEVLNAPAAAVPKVDPRLTDARRAAANEGTSLSVSEPDAKAPALPVKRQDKAGRVGERPTAKPIEIGKVSDDASDAVNDIEASIEAGRAQVVRKAKEKSEVELKVKDVLEKGDPVVGRSAQVFAGFPAQKVRGKIVSINGDQVTLNLEPHGGEGETTVTWGKSARLLSAKSTGNIKTGQVSEGAGQKVAAYWEENPNPDDVFPNRASTTSPMQVVLLSKDGKTVIRGTAYLNASTKRSGERSLHRYVSVLRADGTVSGERFEELIAPEQGWKLIGALKVAPTKGFGANYSLTAWQKALAGIVEKVAALKRTAGAMEEKIAQGTDFGRTEDGNEEAESEVETDEAEEQVAAEQAEAESKVDAVDVMVEFEPDELAVIEEAIGDKEIADYADLADALAGSEEAMGVIKEMVLDMVSAGMDARAALVAIQEKLYESYGHKKGNASEAGKAAGVVAGNEQTAQPAGRSGNAESGSGAATAKGGSRATQARTDTGAKAESQPAAVKPVVKPTGETRLVDGVVYELWNDGAWRKAENQPAPKPAKLVKHDPYLEIVRSQRETKNVPRGREYQLSDEEVLDQARKKADKWKQDIAAAKTEKEQKELTTYHRTAFQSLSLVDRVAAELMFTRIRHARGRRVSLEEVNAELDEELSRPPIYGQGWVLPSGRFIENDKADSWGGHEAKALEFLKAHDKKTLAELTRAANEAGHYQLAGSGFVTDWLKRHGWVRVAGVGTTMFLEGNPNRTVIKMAMDSGIMRDLEVRMDGPEGLGSRVLYDPTQRFSRRKTRKIGPDWTALEGEALANGRTVADQRADTARFNALLEVLAGLGVNVKLVTERLGNLVSEYGRYQETTGNSGRVQRWITLSLADATQPTVGNFRDLLEEALHAVYANESPARQAQMDRAIAGLTDELLGISGLKLSDEYTEAEAAAALQEERLVAAIGKKLEAEGFNPGESATFAQAIVRWLKDLYHRVVMAVMEASGLGVSPQRVQAYFENRVKSILSGDAQISVIDFLGGPKLSEFERLEQTDPIGYAEMLLPVTRHSATHLRFVDNPREPAAKDLNSNALAQPKVAAQNYTLDFLKAGFALFNSEGFNTMGLTFDDFARKSGFLPLPEKIGEAVHYHEGELPSDVIAEINKGLAAIGQPPVPVDFKLADVSETMQKRMAAQAHRVLWMVKAEADEKRRIAERDAKTKFERLQKQNQELSELLANYEDLEFVGSLAVPRMQTMLEELRKAAVTIGRTAHQSGVLQQVIEALDGKLNREGVTQYEKALNAISKKLGRDKLVDILESVANLGIDWSTASAVDIKALAFASGDKTLAPLLADDKESKVLLAAAIAFGKSNAHVMEALSLRREKADEERKVVNEALKLARESHTSAVQEAKEMVAKHRNLATVERDAAGNVVNVSFTRLGKKAFRLLNRIEQLKTENRQLLDEINREGTFNQWHEKMRPVFRGALTKLEQMMGAQFKDWQLVDGAEYPVPPKPNSKLEAVLANQKVLDLSNPGTLREDMAKLIEWLDNVPVDQRGAEWNDLMQIYKRAGKANIDVAHRAVRQNGFMRLAAPIQDTLRFIGTGTTRLLATRLYNEEQRIRQYVEHMQILGREWEASEADLIKATGAKNPDQFRRAFYHPIMGWLEKNQAKLAEQKTAAEAENAAVRGVIDYLTTDPDTAALMVKPGVKAKFERFLRQTAKAQRRLLANGAELGNKILDQSGDYKVYRDPIGAQLWTSLRSTSENGERVWRLMQSSPWATAKLQRDAEVAAYTNDPVAAAATLKPYITGDIWQRFIRPWVYREGRSAFYAPRGTDGLQVFARRENVIRAFETAGQDLLKFAENLYQLEGGTTDVAEFVGDTLAQWQANYDLLEMIYREPDTGDATMMPQISARGKRFLADARRGEELPSDWLEFLPYDTMALQQITKAQVFQSVYGRNFEAWINNLDTAKREQQALTSAVRGVAQRTGLTGRALMKAVQAEAEAGWKNFPEVGDFVRRANFRALEQAERNLQAVEQAGRDFRNRMELNRSRPLEFRAWYSLLGAMTGAVVSGPGTAWTDNVALVEQPFRKLGFSWHTVKFIAGVKKTEAFMAMNSLLQATHMGLQSDAEWVRMLNDLGWIDDDATIAVKDKMTALLLQEHNLSAGPVSKSVQTLAQAIRLYLSTGIGRAREGTAVYPTFKPQSPFVMLTQISHPSAVRQFWKSYETLVGAAVKHLETSPFDRSNPAFRFTRQQIAKAGFKLNERAWQFYTTRMADYGVGTLEQVAQAAVNRRAKDPRAALLQKEDYVKLAVLAQNEILLDSGTATRAAWLKSTNAGSIVNPLLGWAIHKSYDLIASFRIATGEGGVRDAGGALVDKLKGRKLSEEQEQALSGMRTAMTAMLFGVLPSALAYAFMRDLYDEYVMKRKANVRSLRNVTDAKDAFLTLVDNAARVGTFGIMGEVANSNINFDSARPVTLDSRIFIVSSFIGFQRAVQNWMLQGFDADWATVYRPMLSALGGSGYLQYADSLNGALGLDNQESRVARRMAVSNYLRAAGRELNLDVRKGGPGAISLPTATKMYVGQMVMAAMANDAGAFHEAFHNAKQAAKEGGSENPADTVQRSFAAYHPRRLVFQTTPSSAEYHKMLGVMSDIGQESVASALRLFEYYGGQIGVTAPGKGKAKKPAARAGGLGIDLRMPKVASLDDFRRAAVNFGNDLLLE